MLHRTVWEAPSAHSKNEVSFRLETGVENVTSSCMGRAVRYFEKEVSFRLETGVENVTRTVWDTPSARSKKEVSFRLETGVENVTSNCMVRAVRQFEKRS